MTEDYAKIGTALARGELAREPVPISTEESTSDGRVFGHSSFWSLCPLVV